jgi:very-short-patch-repair endonuclease
MRGQDQLNTGRARSLRKSQTSAESKLWFYIRNRQVDGHKFVRQVPLCGYFVDFLCRELRLVIEVDGATHGTPEEIARDARRTEALNAEGYEVLRINNDDIHQGLDGAIDAIHHAIARRVRKLRPSP